MRVLSMTQQEEHQIITDIAVIKQAIMGNGVKGLADRMLDVEGYIKTHPQKCPMVKSRAQIWGVRVAEAGVIGVLIGGIDLVLRIAKVI